MAKKKASRAGKRKTGRKKTVPSFGNPDTSVLARYSPTDTANAHPDWVKAGFPSYIGPHAGHEATSVREFTHDGHVVRIITTYRVEVDGQPMQTHLSVDEDGQVYTHATPFVTYASAVDLMKAVIDAYPEAFSETGGAGSGHGDHGHDHAHGGGHA
jgi:hypothetical protein